MKSILDSIKTHVHANHRNILIEDVHGSHWRASGLLTWIGCMSQLLTERGISRRDRVAIIVPDGPQLCLSILAVSSHCVAAPLNPKASPDDLYSWLKDLEPSAVLIAPGSQDIALAAAEKLHIPVIRLDTVDTRGVKVANHLPDDAQPDDIALILHTSGTTAKPKMVPLTHRNLLCSAEHIAASLGLGHEDTCLNIMPMFHIHGIVACLLATLISGGKLIVSVDMNEELFFRMLRERKATWYSAAPTRHRMLLDHLRRHPDVLDGHSLRFVRSSSAALPTSVLEQIETCFGVPVVEAYSMTEAAHQMCSNPLPPGIRRPGSVGRAAGPEVAIADDDGNLLPVGSVGEVVIRGVNVTPGYLNLPKDNQGRLDGGWFRTGDLGFFDEDEYLFLTGRVKEIVNRGGEKVSPAEVDAVLQKHPAVWEAACFGIPHPSLGEDIAAAVRLHPDQDADEAILRAFLFERISHFKIPSRILIVDSIPTSSIGKVQRNRLSEILKDSLPAPHVMPMNHTEAFIADVFRKAIPDCSVVGRNDNFFTLGGDSLQGVRVAHQIRDKYKIEFPPYEIFRHPTPASLCDRIQTMRQEQLLNAMENRLASLSEEQLEAFLNKSIMQN